MTYDGSGKAAGLRLYVNGAARRHSTSSGMPDGIDRDGRSASPGQPFARRAFVGQIDDLRIYNRALTPDEINELAMHYPFASFCRECIGKRSKDETATCVTTSSRTPRRTRCARHTPK